MVAATSSGDWSCASVMRLTFQRSTLRIWFKSVSSPIFMPAIPSQTGGHCPIEKLSRSTQHHDRNMQKAIGIRSSSGQVFHDCTHRHHGAMQNRLSEERVPPAREDGWQYAIQSHTKHLQLLRGCVEWHKGLHNTDVSRLLSVVLSYGLRSCLVGCRGQVDLDGHMLQF
jgi:hypothetical protein